MFRHTRDTVPGWGCYATIRVGRRQTQMDALIGGCGHWEPETPGDTREARDEARDRYDRQRVLSPCRFCYTMEVRAGSLTFLKRGDGFIPHIQADERGVLVTVDCVTTNYVRHEAGQRYKFVAEQGALHVERLTHAGALRRYNAKTGEPIPFPWEWVADARRAHAMSTQGT